MSLDLKTIRNKVNETIDLKLQINEINQGLIALNDKISATRKERDEAVTKFNKDIEGLTGEADIKIKALEKAKKTLSDNTKELKDNGIPLNLSEDAPQDIRI